MYNFFYKFDDNAWFPVENSPQTMLNWQKMYITRAVTRVVTRSSYGNALYYCLSIFEELGNVW